MCIKISHNYHGCKHAVDRTPSGKILAVIKPCPTALNGGGINKPLEPCGGPETFYQYLKGRCSTCNPKSDLFWTKEYKHYLAVTRPWMPEVQDIVEELQIAKEMEEAREIAEAQAAGGGEGEMVVELGSEDTETIGEPQDVGEHGWSEERDKTEQLEWTAFEPATKSKKKRHAPKPQIWDSFGARIAD